MKEKKEKSITVDQSYKKYKSFLMVKKAEEKNTKLYFFFGLSGFFGVFVGSAIASLTSVGVKDITPMLTVLGAAVVSFLVAEQSKENEINKHREKWCSDLRNHFSEFSSVINAFSRKYQRGVYDNKISKWDAFKRLNLNLKKCDEEIKEIDRVHHVLALYLISGEKDDPRNIIFNAAEKMINDIHISSGNIKEYGDQWEGITNPAEHRLREAHRRFEALRNLTSDRITTINFLVKVYLDSEWEKIKENKYGDHDKKSYLYSALLFLIFLFFGFVFI